MKKVYSVMDYSTDVTHSKSTLAVASSNIKIVLLRSNALARQNSCLCPTLKVATSFINYTL